MRISLIVAVSRNGVIGRDGKLPWHLSSDLKRFRRLTMNHAIVMGRRTWDSIGRPLPGRVSIVLSRQKDFRPPGALVARDLDEAIDYVRRTDLAQDEVFVIGGGEIYALAADRAERIYLTRVDTAVEGDATFPELDWTAWQRLEETAHAASEKDDYPHTFEIWEKVAPSS